MSTTANPLVGPPPTEVPLKDPPLVRVLAQVRFSPVVSVANAEFIASFQEAIRKDYPFGRKEASQSVVPGPPGAALNPQPTIAWRFLDAAGQWRVTLTQDFMALETEHYISRDDFLRRFEFILKALKVNIDPGFIERVGIRYIDRLVGEALNSLPTLIRHEVAGVLNTSFSSDIRHSICENLFVLPDRTGQLAARWGQLPAGGTVDPAAIEAIDAPSWLLDIDAFHQERQALDVEAILESMRGFAERIYSVFRWTVTDEFLRYFGGEP